MVRFTASTLVLVSAASLVSAHWREKVSNNTEIHITGSHLGFNATHLSSRAVPQQQQYLDAHNNERSKHGAVALVWDDSLSASAQAWANQCKFEHSQAGQNLAAGTGNPSAATAVGWWNAESREILSLSFANKRRYRLPTTSFATTVHTAMSSGSLPKMFRTSSVSAHWHGKTFNTTEIHMTGTHLEFNATLHTTRGLSGRTEWTHQEYIDAHNNERAKHGATAIVWDDFLSASAQAWSDQCKFERSRAGQNLAAGTGGPTPAVAVGWWNAEACEYDPKNPQASHWTQVVWKSTTRFGCAVTQCAAGTIFPVDYRGVASFFVCHYSPYGNVVGQFAQNVQK
ncbi:unnamed protein product [Rhizoctonia solani]|uniref:SCP domain-containing protein n=1 Tax=Rhizoctonia solani TaxID=456999 RepID=A0A8H3AZA9_9AGAM|nr:unnamed protein product [Rhizoctonia solani]